MLLIMKFFVKNLSFMYADDTSICHSSKDIMQLNTALNEEHGGSIGGCRGISYLLM